MEKEINRPKEKNIYDNLAREKLNIDLMKNLIESSSQELRREILTQYKSITPELLENYFLFTEKINNEKILIATLKKLYKNLFWIIFNKKPKEIEIITKFDQEFYQKYNILNANGELIYQDDGTKLYYFLNKVYLIHENNSLNIFNMIIIDVSNATHIFSNKIMTETFILMYYLFMKAILSLKLIDQIKNERKLVKSTLKDLNALLELNTLFISKKYVTDEDFKKILWKIKHTYNATTIALLTYSPKTKKMFVRYCVGKEGILERKYIEPNKGISSIAFLTGEVYYTNDVSSDPYFYSIGINKGSAIALPLTVKNKAIYVLYLHFPEKNYLNEELILTLKTLAKNLALALEKQDFIEKDLLTGLYNRSFFDRVLKIEKRKYSIIYIDLNNFKWINDNLGHETGDLVLIKLAELLLSTVREEDYIIRYGGDEFIIVTHEPKQSVEKICNRLAKTKKIFEEEVRRIIRQKGIKDEKIHVSFSFGYACYDEFQNKSLEELVKIAEERNYLDKDNFYKKHTRYRTTRKIKF